ncbi:hypothetical protein DPMN_138590 [Dreissena polymorpha]|uniref:Uncharacterized protein n=1 Tax=Dreissena polymorpha TaxID=45954 RepID=A0A9D4JEU1_DREPO|nr:hypothetical protein DPMN_138590 [Dreissena polymorpha]
MARQRPTRLVMGPCIIEIDRIPNFGYKIGQKKPLVIIEVQYRLEVNQCRKEEIIVKGNFGWMWSMLAWRPRIGRFVIREVQYQFEVNRCRNEEVNEIVARADRQTNNRTDSRDNHNIKRGDKNYF